MKKRNFNKRITFFFQKVKFEELFIIWFSVILIFGILFYILNLFTTSKLIENGIPIRTNIFGLLDSFYFSVITTATVGYGDIRPTNISKLLAIIEVIIGLVLNGALIAKIVSVKEETMLEEIYDISYDSKIDKIRNNFHSDRISISNFFNQIETKKIKKIDNRRLPLLYYNLETHLKEVNSFLMSDKSEKEFIKKLDNYKINLILTGILLALDRFKSLDTIMQKNELSYKKKNIEGHIKNINIYTKRILKIASKRKDQAISEKSTIIKKYLKIILNQLIVENSSN